MVFSQDSGVPYVVVDAFTDEAFCGNPAAVCLLEAEKDAYWMQKVASEFNIAETAFIKKRSRNANASPKHDTALEFDLRWFSPFQEADLCGHATLASAFFVFSCHRDCNLVLFHTMSGILTAKRVEVRDECKIGVTKQNVDKFSVKISLPQPTVSDCDASVLQLLPNTLKGFQALDIKRTSLNDIIIEIDSGEQVEDIRPDSEEVRKCNARGVLITGAAPNDSTFDFISRVFGVYGVDEDPVCGSAHCGLATYWAKKLDKNKLFAHQVSSRGGKLKLQVESDKKSVTLQGDAVLVMSGIIAAS